MPTKTETKERPILFTKENRAKAIEGLKTQTRRVIKPQQEISKGNYDHGHWSYHTSQGSPGPTCSVDKGHPDDGYWIYLGRNSSGYHTSKSGRFKCPYGKVGDRLWVKETWRCTGGGDLRNIIYQAEGDTAMSFCGVDDGRTEILKVPESHWSEWDKIG